MLVFLDVLLVVSLVHEKMHMLNGTLRCPYLSTPCPVRVLKLPF